MIRDAECTRIRGKVINHRLHDPNVLSVINAGFSFTSFDHLHGSCTNRKLLQGRPLLSSPEIFRFPASQYIPDRSITALHVSPA